VEVVPRIPLRPIPHAPPFVAGLFNHGGIVVPVIDLGQLLDGRACVARLSTRVILVDYPATGKGAEFLGLVAEDVTDLRVVRDSQVSAQPTPPPTAPYLGPILQVGEELVQIIVIERLLPDDLRETLFGGMLGLPS
jgi:chemotaxis-related protein WspB